MTEDSTKAPAGPANDMAVALLGAPATLITAGALMALIGLSSYPPLDMLQALNMALAYGGGAAALYMAIGFAQFIRNKISWKILAALPMVSAAGFILTAFGAIVLLNGALDSSPPGLMPAMVMDAQAARPFSAERLAGQYMVHVSSWQAPGRVEKLAVSREVFDRVVPFQDTAAVTVRSGMLGLNWVGSIELMPGSGESR
ncbi:MAG: hypothetical protein OEV92_05460 [Nitrospinota bacterium]|nr:hypothetical protein [Nitrospinota bacterium]